MAKLFSKFFIHYGSSKSATGRNTPNELMYFTNLCSQQMINRQNTSSGIMPVCSYGLWVANKGTTTEADLMSVSSYG